MTIFNAKKVNGNYPTMRFCKTLNNGDDYRIIDEVENVMFYCVYDKEVEVWTYPRDNNNMKRIKKVDFVNIF